MPLKHTILQNKINEIVLCLHITDMHNIKDQYYTILFMHWNTKIVFQKTLGKMLIVNINAVLRLLNKKCILDCRNNTRLPSNKILLPNGFHRIYSENANPEKPAIPSYSYKSRLWNKISICLNLFNRLYFSRYTQVYKGKYG